MSFSAIPSFQPTFQPTVQSTAPATLLLTVGTRPCCIGAVAFDPNNNEVFATNSMSDTVSVINANTNQVISSLTVGNGPGDMAFDPNNNEVYVGNTFANTVSVINANTNTVITIAGACNPALCVGPRPGSPPPLDAMSFAVDTNNNEVYVGEYIQNVVYAINANTNTLLTGTNYPIITSGVSGMAFDPNNNEVYVATEAAAQVSVINAKTDTTLPAIPSGSYLPWEIAFDPNNNELYVTNCGTANTCGTTNPSNGNKVSVINANTNAFISYGSILVSTGPVGVAVDTNNNEVYVTTPSSGAVHMINANTNTVSGSPITVDLSWPIGIAVDTNNNELYVANSNSNTVAVIPVSGCASYC
jgi:YVTN family beta-propeller protein